MQISSGRFNDFEMRGFHLTQTAKTSKNPDSPRKGIEVFAGQARPTTVFYDKTGAKLFGAMIPVKSSDDWQLRAGLITVIAGKNNQSGRGGTVLHLNGSYAPNKKFSADGEMGFANGAVSWGARLNLKSERFGAFAEISRIDKNSPLGSVNRLSGGRRSEAFSAHWKPAYRLNFSVNYSHSTAERFSNFRFANFSRATFSANAGYRPNQNSRLSFRFSDRQIETAVPGSASKFQIAARTFAAGYNIRFNKHLSNDFEAGINFSREADIKSELETGFNLREQMRFSWSGNSLTGFFNYTYRTPSLMSLIVRNPQLLPAVLQPSFALNPAVFLQIYRDRLASLLPGIELPQTRSMDTGFRFQKTVSRFTLAGETRYGAGKIYSQNQKNLFTLLQADISDSMRQMRFK